MSGKWLVELGDAINCKECRYGSNCNVGRGHGYKVGKCTQFEREKKQTNADRIRAMTNRELARLFSIIEDEPDNLFCMGSWEEWLEKESVE